ncbi:MAG: hypothetical protein MUF18_01285 [Fimbriiglobus sp.]|nr:hypothetical protein [Fimbriiglobus sp.]
MFRRTFLRPEAAFFLLAWLGLAIAFQSRAFNDPGALWHVRVGELILDHGFMTTDPFTYTFAGRTWIPQQWGGELLMALAHRAGGLDAMLLGFAAGTAGLFTWVFSRMVRNGMHPLLAGGVAAFALVVSAFHFYARPHMFTILGMGVTTAAVVDYERGRAGLWRLWWLIPFNVLWANVHGGVLGGVMTFGMAVGGWAVVWGWGRLFASAPAAERGTNFRSLLTLAAVVVACGLTPFINPFGMEMLNTWKKIVGSTAMKELVSEHQPLSLGNTAGQVVVGFAAFYLFALLGTLPRVRVSWLLPLVWLALSFQSIRQGPLFVIVGAIAIADLWPHTVWHRLLKKYGDSLAREPEGASRGWGWLVPAALAMLLSVGLQLGNVPLPVVGRGWAKLDERYIPVALADDVRAVAANPKARLFNDANLGGFVLYVTPGQKIYMDDRFELYGDPWLREYAEVVYEEPQGFEEWCSCYKFDHALLQVFPEEQRSKLEKALSEDPRWVVVSRCDTAVLFRRVAPIPLSPKERFLRGYR